MEEAFTHKLSLLKSSEPLLAAAASRDHPQHVEPDRLRQRPALADDDCVTLTGAERRRDVRRDVPVALLVPRVLLDEVHVVPADDQRAVHLGRVDGARQNAAADRDVAREGALLVDVGTLDGLFRGLEAQADGAVEAASGLAGLGALLSLALGEEVDAVLLLEGLLVLLRVKSAFFSGRESREVSDGFAFRARFDAIEVALRSDAFTMRIGSISTSKERKELFGSRVGKRKGRARAREGPAAREMM